MLGFTSVSRCTKPSVKHRASPSSHSDIIVSALYLMDQGVISKDEYFKIIQADLKYRADNALMNMNRCFEKPYNDILEDNIHRVNDPITLEPLGKYTVSLGGSIYNIDSIIQYFICSGDFRDPITRIPLTEIDILRLDSEAESAGYEFPKLSMACKQSNYYQQQKNFRVFDSVHGGMFRLASF